MRHSPIQRAVSGPARTTFASTQDRQNAHRILTGSQRGTEAAMLALARHRRHANLAEAHRLIAEADENLRLALGLLQQNPKGQSR